MRVLSNFLRDNALIGETVGCKRLEPHTYTLYVRKSFLLFSLNFQPFFDAHLLLFCSCLIVFHFVPRKKLLWTKSQKLMFMVAKIWKAISKTSMFQVHIKDNKHSTFCGIFLRFNYCGIGVYLGRTTVYQIVVFWRYCIEFFALVPF